MIKLKKKMMVNGVGFIPEGTPAMIVKVHTSCDGKTRLDLIIRHNGKTHHLFNVDNSEVE